MHITSSLVQTEGKRQRITVSSKSLLSSAKKNGQNNMFGMSYMYVMIGDAVLGPRYSGPQFRTEDVSHFGFKSVVLIKSSIFELICSLNNVERLGKIK